MYFLILSHIWSQFIPLKEYPALSFSRYKLQKEYKGYALCWAEGHKSQTGGILQTKGQPAMAG